MRKYLKPFKAANQKQPFPDMDKEMFIECDIFFDIESQNLLHPGIEQVNILPAMGCNEALEIIYEEIVFSDVSILVLRD